MRVTIVALVLLLGSMLAACGGGGGRSAASPVGATATATTNETPTATAVSSAATPSPEASPPAAGQPACGTEITESLTLTADMLCDPIGIVVAGDGVVLDLGGHTLSGPGPGRRAWPMPNFDVVGVMVRGDNVTVRNGTIQGFGLSLLVNDARSVSIEALRAQGSYYGIYLYRGGEHTVRDNVVTDNVYGLHLQQSNGNTLTHNDLSLQTHHSPGGYGLYLYSSNDNWFEHNTVRQNLNWGLWFSNSTGNTIVRNNIIGNDPQVSDDSGGNFYYDSDEREGNFWSDYQGSDANGDGVGDVPYSIGGPGRAADIYPFTTENGWEDRSTGTLAPATPPPPPDTAPRAYVALSTGIAALAVDQGAVLDTWQVSAFGPMATSPDGTRLYAIVGDAEAASVVALDTASGAEVARWEAPGALAVGAMYDGKRVIVSTPDSLVEIVLDTGEIRTQKDGADAVAITPSWKHNIVLVTDVRWEINVVYLPNQHAPYRMKLPGAPLQVVDNRAGTRLFALIDGLPEVQVIDIEQFQTTDAIPLGDVDPARARIAPSPDGTTLYVLDLGGSRVVAIDLGTKQRIAQATLDGAAVDFAVSAKGDYLTVVLATGDAGRAVILDRDLKPSATVDLDGKPRSVVAPR